MFDKPTIRLSVPDIKAYYIVEIRPEQYDELRSVLRTIVIQCEALRLQLDGLAAKIAEMEKPHADD